MSVNPYKTICEEAFEANREIPKLGLALYTWGNVSSFDPDRAVFAIKPSGVPYHELTAESMVVLDLDGKVVQGTLRPSSDTPTHWVLYRAFQGIRGVTHTHSTHAVAWAQARRSIPVLGTTHADHSTEAVPCTEFLSAEDVENDYEVATGDLIVRTFKKVDPLEMPMVLVAGHGPFTWGDSAAKSVYHAAVLEEMARMAYLTVTLDPKAQALPPHIIKKHYLRKHGPNAYYGQY